MQENENNSDVDLENNDRNSYSTNSDINDPRYLPSNNVIGNNNNNIIDYSPPNQNDEMFLKSKILSIQKEINYRSQTRQELMNKQVILVTENNIHKWGMFDQGSTILKVSYQTSNYQMRGQIPITVEINNTRGKLQVKSVNVKAVKRVQYKKVQEAMVKYHIEDIMVNKVFGVSVPPNTNSQAYTYTIDLKEEKFPNFNYAGTINPYPKLVDLAFAMPTTDGAAVKCDYFLVVTLSFTSFVTKGYIPKVVVPFTLTHQNLNDYNLEQKEDEDLKKAIAASLLDVKDMKTINEVNINEVNINEIDNKLIKNEEVLDDQKGDNIFFAVSGRDRNRLRQR